MSSSILTSDRIPLISSVATIVFGIFGCFFSLRWFFTRVLGINEYSKKGSLNADILSYEVIAGLAALYMSVSGLLIWFNKIGDINEVSPLWAREGNEVSENENNTYPYLSSSEIEAHILIPMVSYQIVNFFLSFYIHDFKSNLGLIHHIAAVLIAYISIVSPIWQYYGVYFCGICELSSVPFAVAETMSKFERYRIRYPITNQISRVLFVFSFWSLRVGIFIYMSKLFWQDCYHVYFETQKIESLGIFYFYLCSNIFMNCLQIFWGFQMFGYLERTLVDPNEGKIKNIIITKEIPQSNK